MQFINRMASLGFKRYIIICKEVYALRGSHECSNVFMQVVVASSFEKLGLKNGVEERWVIVSCWRSKFSDEEEEEEKHWVMRNYVPLPHHDL